MDLPGRPSGNADALRAAAHVWEHLAWELWQLSRALETKADALARGWSGTAGDAYADVWRQVRKGFYDLDGRIHDVSGRLVRAADAIEGGQAAYDRALAAVGIATVAGIGLTVFTLGLSGAAAAEADSAIAATAGTIIVELEATLARVAALFAESADALGGLASRFAVNFSIRAPELAYGPAGGGAIGVGFALASGVRDPGDLAASGLLGAAESIGAVRRGGAREAEAADESPPNPRSSVPTGDSDSIEEAWRTSLSPAHAAKQAEFDRMGAELADPVRREMIRDPLTARTADAIEAGGAGPLRSVDRRVINRDSPMLNELTDIDIETDHVAIQIKSGRTDGLSTQMQKTRLVTGKSVVALAPRMNDETFRRYQKQGYTVFRSVDDLMDFLKSHS